METRQRRFMDQFSVMIDEAAARGEIRPVNPRILMGALMGALFGLSRSAQGDDKCKFFFDCRDMEPERIGREVSDLIIYGLARRESVSYTHLAGGAAGERPGLAAAGRAAGG